MKKLYIPMAVFVVMLILSWATLKNTIVPDQNWSEYLGGPDRNHYSSLAQINASNVSKLSMAWEYHTQDTGQMQCNPIIVNGKLYGMTASTQPFAIDAVTGRERWRKKKEGKGDNSSTSRGLAYWESGTDKRILYTNGPWLYALDATTGNPVTAFGTEGRTSLKAGLGGSVEKKMVISNTPGTVYGDLIIMPMRLSEGADAAPGHVQAFNIRTGKLAWVFHTIPQPGEYGYNTWPTEAYKNTDVGGANNWAGMAIDQKRGIVYVPTGSAAFDFYGGNRKGSNLFANCLLAINAKTGKLIWHFQFVHHDILDRDPPAPPNLITITRKGKRIDAVAQVTKQGYVFVFDRVTGSPLFPVKERSVPASNVEGEFNWPTQPLPDKPEPYARQIFTEQDINPYAENRDQLVETFRKSRSEGPFTPLSKQGTIVYPGLDGGAEWGGAAADPEGILYVNSSEMAWLIAIGARESENQLKSLSSGHRVYMQSCASCHGAERKGNPNSGFPSLVNISTRQRRDYVMNIITHGKGMMPAFTAISDLQKQALVGFLYGDEESEPGITEPQDTSPKKAGEKTIYKISGYTKFLDKNGYPAVRPPWGTLNAIDLNTGEYVWKIPFGEYPELKAKGVDPTGSESYGGPVVTAGNLLFIAGTKDKKFRAYHKKNGQLLWETELPAAGFATPGTYSVNGKQYVVVACGGTKLGAKPGDSYVAFALP